MKCAVRVLICILHQLMRTQCTTSSSEYIGSEAPIDPYFYYDSFIENRNAKIIENKTDPQYEVEKAAGSMADLFGTNQHYRNPPVYTDFGRRHGKHSFNKNNKNLRFGANNELIPEKASPEKVLAVAEESALLEASKPENPTDDFIKKEILRTGDYWNAVWKEDIDPNTLRTYKNHYAPESIRTKIMPGTKFHQLISALHKMSPRFLYVINKNSE